MSKRILPAMLCLSMFLGLFPAGSVFAAGAVLYEPLRTDYGIFNKISSQNKAFYDYFAKKTDIFNAVDSFREPGGAALIANQTLTRSAATYSWDSFAYLGTGLTALGEIANLGQLGIRVSASFTNDKHAHRSGLKSADSVVYQYLALRTGYSEYALSGFSFRQDGSATERLGDDGEYQAVSFSNTMTLTTGVGRTLSTQYCTDGAPKIGSIVVTFADLVEPTVKSAYVCDASGNPLLSASPDSTAYVRVVFSEPIRFADNSPNHDDVTAVVSDGGSHAYIAQLRALKGNYLVFQFTVPDTIAGQNIVVNKLNLSGLFYPEGQMGPLAISRKNDSISTASQFFTGEGYDKSTTLVTDLAGNPIRGTSADKSVSMTGFYLDGVAPMVKSIDKTGVMNNSDVKTALGKTDPNDGGYLDESDTRAGIGDKIVFTANFNEQIKINGLAPYGSGTFTGMKAVLNVKKGTSDPGDPDGFVVIDSASVSQSQPANGEVGPSKGWITSVTFKPFELKTGMSCATANNEIMLTSIVGTSGVTSITDLSGNTYDDADNPWATLNTTPFILDVTPPVVTVGGSLTPEPDDSYTPIPEAGGTGTVSAFDFPVSIQDETEFNGLRGSFSWVDNQPNSPGYKFEYAITAGETTPTQWLLGVTGLNLPFTQIDGIDTNIHIRPVEGEVYEIGDTALRIVTKDYAGNNSSTTFRLNYAADSVAPAASIAGVSRVYSSGTGTLNVNVSVIDKVAIQNIQYQWTEDANPPATGDAGWQTPIGTYTPGEDASATVEVLSDVIDTGEIFTSYLHIKTSDPAGNVRVTGLGGFTYDLSKPAYTATYTSVIVQEPALTITGLGADNSIAVMVKDPSESDVYYVSVIDPAHPGDVLNNIEVTGTYGYEGGDPTEAYLWRKYSVTETEPGRYTFAYIAHIDGSNSLYNGEFAALGKILSGNNYGPVEVTLLAGVNAAFTYQTDLVDPGNYYVCKLVSAGEGAPVFADMITLNCGANVGNAPANLHSATITTTRDLNNHEIEEASGESPVFDPDDGSDDVLTTLEGVEFTISLSNNVVPVWGVADIDFTKTYIVIDRYRNEKGDLIAYDQPDDPDRIIGKIYLSPQATQTVTLPAYNYPTGAYLLSLRVTSKAAGRVQDFNIPGEAYVDAGPASTSFGISAVYCHTEVEYPGSPPGTFMVDDGGFDYYGPLFEGFDIEGHPYALYPQYSAGNETIYISVNDKPDSQCRLYFTADDVSLAGTSEPGRALFFGHKAIKAWNVTSDGTPEGTVNAVSSRARADWKVAWDATGDPRSTQTWYDGRFVNNAEEVTSGDDYPFTLPLIKNKINAIAYQVANANGRVSEVRYVYIYPVYAPVAGTVSLTDTTKYVKQGELTFTPATGQPMLGVSVWVGVYDNIAGTGTEVDITGSLDSTGIRYMYPLDRSGSFTYCVYTLDSYGNYTFFSPVTWNLTDSGIPVVEPGSIDIDTDGANYTATVTFLDDTIEKESGASLTLYLGDTAKDGLKIPLSTSQIETQRWDATESNSHGIYRVEADASGKEIAITVHGVVGYDLAVTSGDPVSNILHVVIEDSLGNVSDPTDIPVTVSNTKPAYLSGMFSSLDVGSQDYAFCADFNTPVRLGPSLGTNGWTNYQMDDVVGLPVFGDGTHKITFYDVFGNPWTQEIVVDGVLGFGDYSISVVLSETGMTKDPVIVSISVGDVDNAYFNLSVPGWEDEEPPGGYYASSATFSMTENGEISIEVGSAGGSVFEKIYLVNIVDGAPTANLHWYFDEFMSNERPQGLPQEGEDGWLDTDGNVTVWYSTSRPTTPAGGTAASYTFRNGEGVTEYTFQYTDEARESGNITASLADLKLRLKAPQAPVVDEAPPEYAVNIYGKIDGKYNAAGYYGSVGSSGTLSDAIADAGYVQGYYLDVGVTEDSLYKVALLPGVGDGSGADVSEVTYANVGSVGSAAVPGATIFGRTITITGDAEFTVVIVDNAKDVGGNDANNKISFPIVAGQYLDNTSPTAQTVKVNTDLYKSTAFFSLSDTSDKGVDTGAVMLLAPSGLAVWNDPHDLTAYNGWYYHTFSDNRTFTITFADAAGNKGTAAIAETGIDTVSPTAGVKWSPYYRVAAGSDVTLPPNNLTNQDVMARISYDKPIDTVDVDIRVREPGTGGWGGWMDIVDDAYVTITRASLSTAVTFHQGNVSVRLVATALNGRSVTTDITLDDIIDKTMAHTVFSVVLNHNSGYETGTPRSATITITPGEDVYFTNLGPQGAVYGPTRATKSISDTVYTKGRYTYAVTDMAGNCGTVLVIVDAELDSTPPVISLSQDPPVGGLVNVSISTNEVGKIQVRGPGYSLDQDVDDAHAGLPLIFTLENNGSYGVTAIDRAGNGTKAAFIVGSIDTTKPNIAFNPTTVSIRQSATATPSSTEIQDLDALLDANITVWDDKTEVSGIIITRTGTVDLSTVGTYAVTYKVKDAAGNERTAVRYVKVYSRHELEVLLNGDKTENGGTTVLTGANVTLSVVIPHGAEPYTVYLSSGLKSEGQMKAGYTIVYSGESRTATFTLPSTGFHTLYIVTQSRQTYLTKLYVQP